jgi:hypothetical protein
MEWYFIYQPAGRAHCMLRNLWHVCLQIRNYKSSTAMHDAASFHNTLSTINESCCSQSTPFPIPFFPFPLIAYGICAMSFLNRIGRNQLFFLVLSAMWFLSPRCHPSMNQVSRECANVTSTSSFTSKSPSWANRYGLDLGYAHGSA